MRNPLKNKILFKRIILFITVFIFTIELIHYNDNGLFQQVSAANLVEIWRKGQKIASYNTIQTAIDNAATGDIVRIRAGTYYENVTINKTITLEGAEGEKVIIDGADPELQLPDNGRWTHLGGGVYSATVPYDGPNPQTTWISYTSNDKLIHPYMTEEKFNLLENGEGSVRDANIVKVKLDGDINPNSLGLNISIRSYLIVTTVNCTIRNVTVKNAVNGGINLSGKAFNDILIENVEIVNSHRGINAFTEGSSGIKILNCKIYNGWREDWAWKTAYESGEPSDSKVPMRGHGIFIHRSSNCEIAYNEIEGNWDGMRISGENISIHDNKIHNINDDAIELESNVSKNLHFYNNIIWDCFTGISQVPNGPGPVYIYRNFVVCNKLIRYHINSSSRRPGYCLKMGVGTRFTNSKIYNNSFYSEGTILFDRNQAVWEDVEFINNIMYTKGTDEFYRSKLEGSIERPNQANWDYNLWVRAEAALRNDENAIVNDLHAVIGDPLYINPLQSPPDLRVFGNSPVINKGLNIVQVKSWPDSVFVSDGKYDIGAFEYNENDMPNFTIKESEWRFQKDGETIEKIDFVTCNRFLTYVPVVQNNEAVKDLEIILAIYKGDKLLKVGRQKYSLNQSTSEQIILVSLDTSHITDWSDVYAKAFIWDSINNLKPLSVFKACY